MSPRAQHCNHSVLSFSSQGLYVVCRKCERTWLAMRSDGSVDSEASNDGMSDKDIRVVPEPVTRRTR